MKRKIEDHIQEWNIEKKDILYLISIIFSLGMIFAQFQTVISNQRELTIELRDWKKQAETRLGTVENKVAVIQSHLPDIKW